MNARFRRLAFSVIRSLLRVLSFSGQIGSDDGQGAGEENFVDVQLAPDHRFFRLPLVARHRAPLASARFRDVLGRLELVILGFRCLASSYAAISPLDLDLLSRVRAVVRPL